MHVCVGGVHPCVLCAPGAGVTVSCELIHVPGNPTLALCTLTCQAFSLQPPVLFLISSSLVIFILQKISAESFFIAVELLEIGLLSSGAHSFKALDM